MLRNKIGFIKNMVLKWLELAHEKKGSIYPTLLYWYSVQSVVKEVGVEPGIIGCWYRRGEFSYLTTPGGLLNSARVILSRLKDDQNLIGNIVKINKKEIPQLLEVAHQLSGDLSSLSGEELNKKWQDFTKIFSDLMTYSAMATVMEMEEPVFTKEAEKTLTEKLGKGHPKLGEYFQILTTCNQRTVAREEEIELLKLRKKQLENNLEDKDLEDHKNKYSWIAYGYSGPGWGLEDFKNRLAELPDSDLDQVIEQEENKEKEVIKKQQTVVEEIKLSDDEKKLFEIFRILGFWKFERKSRCQQAHELMDNFIDEISKRENLSIQQVKMMTSKEISLALLGEKIDLKILNERLQECLVIIDGMDYRVFSGDSAKGELQDLYESLKVDDSIKEIKGTVAFPGFIKGIIKRVDDVGDMDKFNQGDILVSTSTTPKIIPAMRRAGAIITDTGGITCHAAIVSRELKVPCIIGTRIATKVLKDGDMVEVDADKGIIKKIV